MNETDKTQLEAVYLTYINNQGFDGKEANQRYEHLEQTLQEYTWKKQNEIQCAVNELCAVIERKAFLDGVRAGAKLVLELID